MKEEQDRIKIVVQKIGKVDTVRERGELPPNLLPETQLKNDVLVPVKVFLPQVLK